MDTTRCHFNFDEVTLGLLSGYNYCFCRVPKPWATCGDDALKLEFWEESGYRDIRKDDADSALSRQKVAD
ncbi:hypothetical protein GN244_ATG05822 [Phytophthora infestans]|uniref:Uncharacterized protein n=1 Tax=Phytophthora infestans TaxID=4787 RepID=A0A833TJ76_PHYIN|nr:hypothetical protein GN244_ATG05822 [Phytophthora infestans]KAF4137552.1 hypothetical protein GN958_ATG13234 [Phytophthora infestans]